MLVAITLYAVKYKYMRNDHKYPYQSFGEVLKKLRSKAAKSSAEVSSAIEIDESRLQKYEAGEQRPTEDILLLLIQHFELQDDQATELWKLAGYSGEPEEDQYFINDESGGAQQITVGITPQDARIVYTDMIQVMVNNYGVIINFMQGAGPSNQPLAVSRVGMSKEHARSVLEVLQKTLDQADNPPKPKQIQAPESENN
jgi:transcriptional regulator with XRE-family HTH domain